MVDTKIKPSYKDIAPDTSIGLCLAGGGGLGFMHIGLFQAMEELGIKPGIVAGTSSGAVLGALYSYGYSSSEMLSLLREFRWTKIVAPAIPRRGFLTTTRMQAFFKRFIGEIDICDLPIRLKIAAVDLHTGELKGFESGPIGKCLAASCTVPGIFEPVTIAGRTYYDAGGIFNLPLELLSGEKLDIIIAGNTIGEYGLMKEPKTVQDTLYQSYYIRTKQLTRWRTGPGGWAGKKQEKLILIDYRSHGVNPVNIDECEVLIQDTRKLSLEILKKAEFLNNR